MNCQDAQRRETPRRIEVEETVGCGGEMFNGGLTVV